MTGDRTRLRVLSGAELLGYADGLRDAYAETFAGPPWHEDASDASAAVARLVDDVERPGFLSAVALRHTEVVGFATAWTTPAPFPDGRCYPQVAAGLGAERAERWLSGGRETDELAVRPGAQGTGIGAALLAAVSAGAPEGRAWLLTSVGSPGALAFYRRQGWTQATHPSPAGKGVVVFLGPDHPARSLALSPP